MSFVRATRRFSTTPASRSILDYLKFYKKNDDNVPKVKPTAEVMKEAEADHRSADELGKIEVLGRRSASNTDKEVLLERLNGFQIHRWIPKNSLYSKAVAEKSDYTEAISEVLGDIKNQAGAELDDLTQRFKVLKLVQQKFGLQIPDPQLSRLGSFDEIERYLTAQLNPAKVATDELVPDKVHFDVASLEGTNVSVGKFVFDSQKKKELKTMLRKANKLEQEAAAQH